MEYFSILSAFAWRHHEDTNSFQTTSGPTVESECDVRKVRIGQCLGGSCHDAVPHSCPVRASMQPDEVPKALYPTYQVWSLSAVGLLTQSYFKRYAECIKITIYLSLYLFYYLLRYRVTECPMRGVCFHLQQAVVGSFTKYPVTVFWDRVRNFSRVVATHSLSYRLSCSCYKTGQFI